MFSRALISDFFTGFSLGGFAVFAVLSLYFSPSRDFEIYVDSGLKPFVYGNLIEAEEIVSNTIGAPTSISIPVIGIEAVVRDVGVAEDGLMQVPKNPAVAGWFKLGPRPGESGQAIIVGHYGWINRVPAIFDDLYKLKIGDELYVEDDLGVVRTFIVNKKRIYKYNEDPNEVFRVSGEAVGLILITCHGAWNREQSNYEERLVVFTEALD